MNRLQLLAIKQEFNVLVFYNKRGYVTIVDESKHRILDCRPERVYRLLSKNLGIWTHYSEKQLINRVSEFRRWDKWEEL